MRRPVNPGKNFGDSTNAPTAPITRGNSDGTSAPRTRTDPAVERTRPNRHRIVVVLPAPFGPRKPNTPPAGTSRSRPATATAVPDLERYSLRRPRIEIGYPSPSVTSHIRSGLHTGYPRRIVRLEPNTT